MEYWTEGASGKTIMAVGAGLLLIICAVPLSFGQTNRTAAGQLQTQKAPLPEVQLDPPDVVSCRFAGGSYKEGTAIQGDRIPEQMCVRAPNPPANGQMYHAEWIRISNDAKERSRQVVVLPDTPDRSLDSFCRPKAGEKKGYCGCEGASDFAAGAMARSGKGAMQCSEGGWRPLVSCVVHDAEYPEGAVIRTGDSYEQMCVRVLNVPLDPQSHETHLDWVRSSKELRDRSNHLTMIIRQPVLCKAVPAKAPGLCGCEGFSDFGPKSIMQSANGPLQCEDGEWKLLPKDSTPK